MKATSQTREACQSAFVAEFGCSEHKSSFPSLRDTPCLDGKTCYPSPFESNHDIVTRFFPGVIPFVWSDAIQQVTCFLSGIQ